MTGHIEARHTGIYRYSRNPQNLGLLLIFLGISLAGRSPRASAHGGVCHRVP
ncbi:methyltransferase [Thermococcus sp.]|uniref:methyltransferase n=1 Tax=Thermococcus sp. TaxID=35749 RepID=UPI00345C7DD5